MCVCVGGGGGVLFWLVILTRHLLRDNGVFRPLWKLTCQVTFNPNVFRKV